MQKAFCPIDARRAVPTMMLMLIASLLSLSPGYAQEPENGEDSWQPDGQSGWEEDWSDEWGDETDTFAPPFHGFVSWGYGVFIRDDRLVSSAQSLAELRTRLEWQRDIAGATLSAKGDLYYDDVMENGSGRLRELMLGISPLNDVDIRAGRQILTWGTGDLLFLNDAFPKDWQSFFSGLDQEYLKAPSDAIKISYFSSAANLDLVWAPQFDPDNYLTGERFSYYDPLRGSLVAAPPPLQATGPEDDDGELALRIYQIVGGWEWAAYGYRGFTKQPLAFDLQNGLPTFAPLSIYGASIRGTVAGGLLSSELAYYDSRRDRDGDKFWLPNSQWRFLLGFERELIPRLTLALQYYLEHIRQYSALINNSQHPTTEPDKNRSLMTVRLTWRLWRDNLILSLFTFYSPTDRDHYWRPNLSYRLNDNITVATGANIFAGREQHTFFGQLEEDSNAWFRITYNF